MIHTFTVKVSEITNHYVQPPDDVAVGIYIFAVLASTHTNRIIVPSHKHLISISHSMHSSVETRRWRRGPPNRHPMHPHTVVEVFPPRPSRGVGWSNRHVVKHHPLHRTIWVAEHHARTLFRGRYRDVFECDVGPSHRGWGRGALGQRIFRPSKRCCG